MAWSMNRSVGADATVFSIGGKEHICDIRDATLTIEWQDTNVGTICDPWSAAYPVSYGWRVEGTMWPSSNQAASSIVYSMIGAGGTTMTGGQGIGATATPLAIVITTPAGSISGNGIFTSITHSASRNEVQSYKFTLLGVGDLS